MFLGLCWKSQVWSNFFKIAFRCRFSSSKNEMQVLNWTKLVILSKVKGPKPQQNTNLRATLGRFQNWPSMQFWVKHKDHICSLLLYINNNMSITKMVHVLSDFCHVWSKTETFPVLVLTSRFHINMKPWNKDQIWKIFRFWTKHNKNQKAQRPFCNLLRNRLTIECILVNLAMRALSRRLEIRVEAR